MNNLAYLATPYSHPSKSVMELRFEKACRIAASLLSQGIYVLSPIVHNHPLAVHGELPTGWDFWEPYDRVMMDACNRLIIGKLPGWQDSKGIAGELEYMRECGKPILYLNPDTMEITPE